MRCIISSRFTILTRNITKWDRDVLILIKNFVK